MQHFGGGVEWKLLFLLICPLLTFEYLVVVSGNGVGWVESTIHFMGEKLLGKWLGELMRKRRHFRLNIASPIRRGSNALLKEKTGLRN